MKTLRILTIVDDVQVVGPVLHTSFQEGRHQREIPPFFHRVLEEKRLTTVPHRTDRNQLCVFKMTPGSPAFDYVMGVEVEQTDAVPEGMDRLTLPRGEYAVMTIIKRGPEDVGSALAYILEQWLPHSDYAPTGAPAFIYYDERFFSVFDRYGYAGNPVADVYVPLQPRS